MSFEIVLGSAGYGKTEYVYEQVIKAAEGDPGQSLLLVVPDQYTMQTQADIVAKSPGGGIAGVEVLSFSRLAHRVFEQTGGARKSILDDTGKNLVLRRCCEDVRESIPYLAGKLDKPGYIHEVKSAISEFMQYGIGQRELETLNDYAKQSGRKALMRKLADLSVIYGRFMEYIKERYITTEEALDVLAADIYKCELTRDSIVIFDGFTGFTPVQNKVISALLDVSKKLVITLTLPEEKAATDSVNEQDLFAFTHKSYRSLCRIADEKGIKPDIIALRTQHRHADHPELSFLEEQLFRYSGATYDNTCNDIFLIKSKDIRDDVRGLVGRIRSLIREKGVCYRDIAVIAGNLDAYASELEDILTDYEIPYFLDRNRGIELNPFAEYVRAAIDMIGRDYDYESVFRYLRSGFTDIDRDDIDVLENYVLETGIRGYRMYSGVFSRTTASMRKNDSATEELMRLNSIREAFIKGILPLTEKGIDNKSRHSGREYVKALYDFIYESGSAEKLSGYAEFFRERTDYSAEREYAQIYRYTMELLEQIYSLAGDEIMDIKSFSGLIDAGFDEIKVGIIPQSVDRLLIGDMQRTRLKPVKYLFFLGLNDDWVPKDTGRGGIISDPDREFLSQTDIEMAPTPKQQMYIDRFYLYLNLTKPTDGLFLSYVAMDSDSKALRPSYIAEHILKLYPKLILSETKHEGIEQIESYDEARSLYATYVRDHARGTLKDKQREELKGLTLLLKEDGDFCEKTIEAAFGRYEKKKLDERIAALLYGSRLYASVSRMETYARCAYAYFIRYGLGIEGRAEYGVESSDLGNIYHGVLEVFSGLLEQKGLDWTGFTDQEAEDIVSEAVEKEAALYTDAVLFESENGRYVIDRMKGVMMRTVKTIAYQLKKGEFTPYRFEYRFDRDIDADDVKLRVTGKIDRLDICEDADKVLVKITDYKSGSKNFSLLSFYHGIQLQMVVYMNRAVECLKEEYKDKQVIPAAMLYYHIDDPLVNADESESDEAIEKKVLESLCTKGILDPSDEIVSKLDNAIGERSDVIPIKANKSGVYGNTSGSVITSDMELISKYADLKMQELARRIKTGDIAVDPKELRSSRSVVEEDSCRYCDYRGICGFDERMPGYKKEKYLKEDEDTMLGRMREAVDAEA